MKEVRSWRSRGEEGQEFKRTGSQEDRRSGNFMSFLFKKRSSQKILSGIRVRG